MNDQRDKMSIRKVLDQILIKVDFTPNLRRHLTLDSCLIEATTVAEVLEQLFASQEKLRGYILDDQGAVRKHINIFVDNRIIRDPVGLTDKISESSDVFIMQALSGG